MDRAISIGNLRQNPTAMIRAVKHGETFTLTERGQPIAEISPPRGTVWRRGSDVAAALAAFPPDPAWASDVETLRRDAALADPWDRG